MPMSSEQIRTKPFLTERKGGYNKDEVVAFLEEVADEFEALQSRMGEAQSSSDPSVIAELEDLRSRMASHDGLQDALEKAYADVEQLRSEVSRAREERDALSQKLTSSTDPTAAIGEEVAMVLRAAKEAASELKDRAQRESAELKDRVERESAELKDRAERESAELRGDAEQARSSAEAAATRLRADAEAQASEIIAQARREADDLLSREMVRYDELLSAQSEVTRRLEDAESVIRSVRDRLGTSTPEPAAYADQGQPEATFEPQPEPAAYEPQPEVYDEPQPEPYDQPQPEAGEAPADAPTEVTASDWFNQPAPEHHEPNGSTQEFAG